MVSLVKKKSKNRAETIFKRTPKSIFSLYKGTKTESFTVKVCKDTVSQGIFMKILKSEKQNVK